MRRKYTKSRKNIEVRLKNWYAGTGHAPTGEMFFAILSDLLAISDKEESIVPASDYAIASAELNVKVNELRMGRKLKPKEECKHECYICGECGGSIIEIKGKRICTRCKTEFKFKEKIEPIEKIEPLPLREQVYGTFRDVNDYDTRFKLNEVIRVVNQMSDEINHLSRRER